MKATTCQMSNVCCAMLNVVVKASDQTTKFLVGERLRHMVIAFDSFGLSSFFSQLP